MENFTKSDYGQEKLDQSNMLNSQMSITSSPADEYENTIHGGGSNG